ncbi:endonuclease/exonuclease/phosphatase family protein [Xanthobacter autotrophicus]|uniref:endonuclease/exonuclease/phosphatase family protein n=1 Tax=Xanthobacter autotrophicus TaxID=280 RepID=UPI0024A656DB|nr:endonuclease/exonuclease/phosphatase family protein [Xanthobacter autotrophicus]MDI4657199.1 endonuclease/exonuclease/phosphatase family protein [Xanthobacter autotrophicus]
MWKTIVRHQVIGALVCLAFVALLVGVFSAELPLQSPLGTLARVLEGLAPQIFVCAGLLGLLLAALGARLWAGMVLVLVVLTGGAFALGHRERSLPLAAEQTALRLVFFNIETQEPSPRKPARPGEEARAQRIADALLAAGPDIAVLAESPMLLPALPRLEAAYPHRVGCTPRCEILVLSRLPLSDVTVKSLGRMWQDRFMRIGVALADGRQMTLIAAHMSKPWFSGTIEREYEGLEDELNKVSGPLVVVGDFNAPPWSRPVKDLIDLTGIRAARWPMATWPVPAGAAGVPIDNIFVRGGARLTALAPFGADLGSNHRGLVVGIALPVP